MMFGFETGGAAMAQPAHTSAVKRKVVFMGDDMRRRSPARRALLARIFHTRIGLRVCLTLGVSVSLPLP